MISSDMRILSKYITITYRLLFSLSLVAWPSAKGADDKRLKRAAYFATKTKVSS
jgi:hypothetical protein